MAAAAGAVAAAVGTVLLLLMLNGCASGEKQKFESRKLKSETDLSAIDPGRQSVRQSLGAEGIGTGAPVTVTASWGYPATAIRYGMIFDLESSQDLKTWSRAASLVLTNRGGPAWQWEQPFSLVLSNQPAGFCFYRVGARW